MSLSVQTDDWKVKTNETLGVTVGARFYFTRNRVNPLFDIPTDPFNPENWESYLKTPWGETFNLYDSNYVAYGHYYAYRWMNIEFAGNRLQSFIMIRSKDGVNTDAGDTVRRIYKNDVDIKTTVITAAGITENKLLGIVVIPNTSRL